MFKEVSTKLDFAEKELEILKYWKDNKIFEKSLKLREGKIPFVFYEGPPTANGIPHPGHILTRVLKDAFPRYKTMRGYFVNRKGGWDTHGLPVEIEVEKELKLNGKKDIESYGIEKFIKKCKESVFRYREEWEKITERIGFWLDLENAYITLDNNYIESIWYSLKQIYDKGLIYCGHKIVPYCPRCGTALSSHEVSQGYEEVKDPSLFVKFKIKDESLKKIGEDNVSFLVWTTTPWTLISNVALAVKAESNYILVSNKGEKLILAEDLKRVLDGDVTYIKSFKGEDLVNLTYQPLFNYNTVPEGKNAYKVISEDFVTMEEGTGIVHIAPAFGEDDYQSGIKYNLAFFQPVTTEGKFEENITDYKGLFVKDADPKIIADLKKAGKLYKSEEYLHTYPFCWRCDSPLLYYARKSWFIKMTAIKDLMIANNKKINWYPPHIRDGRFGDFLENLVDWGISRERYWGTPIPIWICENEKCNHQICIGSIAELKEKGINVPDNIELHKPYVDEIKIPCNKCGRNMSRIPEVLDCWYDSGCMHTAQWHYPFENKDIFQKNFPADFISEAIDQTRGWFYSLLATSSLLYNDICYKNVIVLGHVLGEDGLKMSKSKGNVVDPWVILNNEGADATRWYFYISSPPWEPKRFYEKAVMEVQQKFMGTLKNVYSFFVLYANVDGFDPEIHKAKYEDKPLIDRWIDSYFNLLIKEVKEFMDNYDITRATRLIDTFVDDLSNWYLRRSRKRFWHSEMDTDKICAYTTLYNILVNLSKLIAPFVPFISEDIYLNLAYKEGEPESVHLCYYPEADEKLIDHKIHNLMEITRKYVYLGRSARNAARIKNRQPLKEIIIGGLTSKEEEKIKEFLPLIQDELNIKEVRFSQEKGKFFSYKILPVFKKLGERYGKLIPKIKTYLENLGDKANEIAERLKEKKSYIVEIDGNKIELTEELVNLSLSSKEGYMAVEEGPYFVAINTTLDEDLIYEGYAREIVNKIQNMRKDSGLEVTDRIEIYSSPSPQLKETFKRYGNYIFSETLCKNLYFENQEEFTTKEWDINGLSSILGIRKFIK